MTSEPRILFRDRHILVARKPAGIETAPYQPSSRSPGRSTRRAHRAPQRHVQADTTLLGQLGQTGPHAPRVVQRLDRPTSGVLVFALSEQARRGLGQQLRVHSVHRRYLALVHGRPPQRARYDTWLVADRGDGRRGSWRGRRPPDRAQRARTEMSLLTQGDDISLISCTLFTGRQHQIRIHLAEAGHPLLGERVYGRQPLAPAAARTMLHAAELGFAHPVHHKPMFFTCPPPADFREAAQTHAVPAPD